MCGDNRSSSGELCLEASQEHSISDAPIALAVADLDLDGHDDVVVASATGTGAISTCLGKGDGTFGPISTIITASPPTALAVIDVDHDGAPDVVASSNEDGGLWVFRNDGRGKIVERSALPTGEDPFQIGVADVNSDGMDDIVISNNTFGGVEATIGVYLATATGISAPAYVSLPVSLASGLAIADVDGDAALDVVVASYTLTESAKAIAILSGDGAGGFDVSAVSIVAPASGVNNSWQGLALADVTGDGFLDAVVTPNEHGREFVRVLPGDGEGNFEAAISFPAGDGTDEILVIDMTNDGDTDVVLTSRWKNTVDVLRADGARGLLPPKSFMVGAAPEEVASGDFNEDGHPDLVVANWGGDSFSVLLADP